MSEIIIKRVTPKDKKIVNTIIVWNYNWWGIERKLDIQQVKYYFKHCVIREDSNIPQTYIALLDEEPVGCFTIEMSDIEGKDIKLCLSNVYVDDRHRYKGICRKMLNSVVDIMRTTGNKEIYTYTDIKGLYEKFDWEFIKETTATWENNKTVRLYKLKLGR